MATKVKTKITSGIGYSPLTEKVYMGRQNQSKQMWVGEKKDVTNQFLDAAFQYFEENTTRTITVKKEKHLFIHVKETPEALKKVIEMLQKKL